MTQGKQNKKRTVTTFIGIYIISYLAFAFGTVQIVPYLTSIGYSPVERGILISSIAIVTIIVQLIFGYLSDKYKTVKKIFIVIMIVFATASWIFYIVDSRQFILHLILVALCGGFSNLGMGVQDNWVLETDERTRNLFSVIRAFGSFGWAIGGIILGYLINSFGYKSLSVTVLFFTIVTLGGCFLLGDASKSNDPTTKCITKDDVIELVKNKSYILVIIILFLLSCIQMFNNYTLIDKIMILGGTSKDVGITATIKGLAELPMFFAGPMVLRKYKAKALLVVSAIAYTIQFILFGFANTVSGLMWLIGLQMLTNPCLIIASKVMIDELTSDACKSTGQLVAMSIYTGGASLLIPYLSGVLTEWKDVNFTLFFAASLGIVALMLISLIKRPRRVIHLHDNHESLNG